MGKKLNIEKSLNMLLKANDLRKNDGYITDSVGWAYYMIGDYINAEKFLKKAVELMPFDPIINDHYADSLWMSKKEIQARYFWKHVLSLKEVEQKLIDLGCPQVNLLVWSNNSEVLKFYKKTQYSEANDIVLLRKRLISDL